MAIEEMFWLDPDNGGTATPHTHSVTYEYDELDRLITEAMSSWDESAFQTIHYQYDETGNRLSKTVDRLNDGGIDETTTYTYDANDRLLTESTDSDGDLTPDQTTAYGYDHTQQT